jgi:hypothetical protein
MPFHLLATEQFRAQGRLLFRPGAGGHAISAKCLQASELEQVEQTAGVQIRTSLVQVAIRHAGDHVMTSEASKLGANRLSATAWTIRLCV